MYARLRGAVVGKPKEDLLVPSVALGYDQQGFYVLVVDDQKIVQRRPVKVGLEVGNRRVVTEGLTGQEWLITDGLIRAFPGKPVNPVPDKPAAAPAAPGANP
jgi:multidrug efflux pump subunit AcrA (membrane-fusion protein)